MANHNFRASIAYRRSRLSAPTATALITLFNPSPRHSLQAVLSRAGPFQARADWIRTHPRDAFVFKNRDGWNMSEEDTEILRARFRRELDAVKLIGIQVIRNALGGVRATVNPPLLPAYVIGLPDVVVNHVLNAVTGPLTDSLLDKVLAGDPNDYRGAQSAVAKGSDLKGGICAD